MLEIKIKLLIAVIATTSLRTTSRPLSKLKIKVSYENYKRTQQGVSNELLLYLYNTYIVCVNDK